MLEQLTKGRDRFFLIDHQRVSVRTWIAREIVRNIRVHREYSSPFPGKIIIERERIYAENWNKAQRHGRIDPDKFTPYPQNSLLARFFVNTGRADKLGSGARDLSGYTKIYSGGEPELIEGDIFKTIVPLGSRVAHKLTTGEKAFWKMLCHTSMTTSELPTARERTGKSEGSVKRFLRNLTKKNYLEAGGQRKS